MTQTNPAASQTNNISAGIMLMIAATVVFALQDGVSRHLAGSYNTWMVVMVRYWFFAAFVIAIAARSPGGIRATARTTQRPLQIFRGPQQPPPKAQSQGITGPDFSNNPYLGQRMHLDASVHYDDAALQTVRDWPTMRAHWAMRLNKIIELIDKYTHLYFIAPPPVVLEAMQEDHPELIPQLLQRIKDGRMEITGGRWCEADTLMIGEESHVRQLLYGQQYYERVLGQRARIAWQTDGKGYVASYPQLLKLADMDQILLKTPEVEGDQIGRAHV